LNYLRTLYDVLQVTWVDVKNKNKEEDDKSFCNIRQYNPRQTLISDFDFMTKSLAITISFIARTGSVKVCVPAAGNREIILVTTVADQ
jgi:hypothetical protein